MVICEHVVYARSCDGTPHPSYTYSNTPWMMGKTKKMDRGFLVSVGTPETAMNPDPKYALLTKIQYDPLNGFAQSKYGMIG